MHITVFFVVVQVRVDHPKSMWYNGNVIFATPSGCVFDIGIIQMHGYIPNKKWSNQIEIAESVHEGTSYHCANTLKLNDHFT